MRTKMQDTNPGIEPRCSCTLA